MRVEIRPVFDETVMASERPVRIAAAKTLKLLQSLNDATELFSHTGLRFEELHGFIEPTTGEQLYSLRITQSVRAIACLLSGPTIVLVSLHTDHDKAYKKR